eukprot:TRINITY_DN2473_c0_g3_i1.p1 TRINITY_DN2473_c0_g3~~TRINITY_DN2473_c0_g3_i1.p1  ORF type:complete len:192 (-),score=6.81 TRINITY_DN2473_c0_g3_i1:211-786(-)
MLLRDLLLALVLFILAFFTHAKCVWNDQAADAMNYVQFSCFLHMNADGCNGGTCDPNSLDPQSSFCANAIVEKPCVCIANRTGDSCENCAAGYGLDANNNCIACPVGSYKAIAGNIPCAVCQRDTYANSTGLTACTTCDPGTYADEGQGRCGSCPANRYLDNGACTVAPAGIKCPPNARSLSYCFNSSLVF